MLLIFRPEWGLADKQIIPKRLNLDNLGGKECLRPCPQPQVPQPPVGASSPRAWGHVWVPHPGPGGVGSRHGSPSTPETDLAPDRKGKDFYDCYREGGCDRVVGACGASRRGENTFMSGLVSVKRHRRETPETSVPAPCRGLWGRDRDQSRDVASQ